ncbi:MAG: cell division protein FtsX [Bacteroidetes bacterium]|nr:MAG: cell division protein FtsX [Bacteroidota bacterium]
MLRNLLKTSLRWLWNHKLFAIVNVLGLASALTVVWFALLYIQFEYSYDQFHQNSERIYRLVTDVNTASGTNYQSSSEPMVAGLQQSFPEIESSTRIFLDYLLVQRNEKNFGEEKIAYADSNFFSFFSFRLIQASPDPLGAPFNIILSQKSAKKYFGLENPVGQRLVVNGRIPAMVTGVIENMPENSQFHADMIFSMSTLIADFNPSIKGSWGYFGFYSYLKLKQSTDAKIFQTKLDPWLKKQFSTPNTSYKLSIEPLTSVYLHGKARGSRTGSIATGNLSELNAFKLVAIFVLILACLNFINLSTAYYFERIKETTLRKIIGASRFQLIAQFLMDATIVSSLAFVFSIGLVVLLLPFFNSICGKTIANSIFTNSEYIAIFLGIALLCGLLSGIYPSINQIKTSKTFSLKEKISLNKSSGILRKALVVIQFSISIIFLITVAVIYKQVKFMQSQDPGFRKDHTLVIDYEFDDRFTQNFESVKDQIRKIPGVSEVCFSGCIPGRANRKNPVSIENSEGEIVNAQWDSYAIDEDFIKQFQVQTIAGRPFSKEMFTDSSEAMLINETAARTLGFHDFQKAVGIRFLKGKDYGIVRGVVKDFHFHSLQEEIQPLTFRMSTGRFTFISVQLHSTSIEKTISELERKWSELAPGLPMSYFFVDDTFNELYSSEKRFGKLMSSLTLAALLISSLGLFGLAAYNSIRRKKEIGIRKALGASLAGVYGMLSLDFLKPVLLSFLFAIPLARIITGRWLENFAYRTNIGFEVFFMSALIVVGACMLTISFHCWKAAKTNPASELRSE